MKVKSHRCEAFFFQLQARVNDMQPVLERKPKTVPACASSRLSHLLRVTSLS